MNRKCLFPSFGKICFAMALCTCASSSLTADDFRLADFRQRVLSENQKLQQKAIEQRIAAELISAEYGIFEPVLVFSGNYVDGERPNSAEQRESQSGSSIYLNRDLMQNMGISGLLPYGTQYRFGSNLNRLKNNQDGNPFSAGSSRFQREDYVLFTGVEITQPLLRDYGLDVTKMQIRRAMADAELRQLALRQAVIDTLARAESAYWDLKLAHEQWRVRKESEVIAKQLLTDTKSRLEAGTVSDLQVYQAETGLMLRETQTREAEQAFREAMTSLRIYMSQQRTDREKTLMVPVDEPRIAPAPPELSAVLEQALRNSPAYLAEVKQLDVAALNIDSAKNDLKPKLDFTANAGLNGLGRNVGGAWEDVRNGSFNTWSVGLRFEMPIGGRIKTRHQIAAAEMREQEQHMAIYDARVELSNTLEMVMGRIESLNMRMASLHKVVEFNQRLLETANDRMLHGKGTSRDVLEVEGDLSEAKSNELKALIDLQKAQLLMEATDGTFMASRNIDVITLYLPPGTNAMSATGVQK